MSEYAEYQRLLLAKRQELLERVNAIARDSQHPSSADSEEQAVELESEEVLSALDEEARHTLQLIEQALQRIESGGYGVCTECGKPISPARLKVLPYAPLCIECAEKTGGA